MTTNMVKLHINEGGMPSTFPIVYIDAETVHVMWRELSVTYRRQAEGKWISDDDSKFKIHAQELMKTLQRIVES